MSATAPDLPLAAPWADRKPWLAPLIVLLAALAVHLAWYTRPLSVVFDEIYFGRYALSYVKGADFFDLHPPLGKLIFAAMAGLLGLDTGFSFENNGLVFPNAGYAWLRTPAHVAGVLLPLVFYGLARELGMSRWAALVVGLLGVLDNAWLVISRLTMIDIFFVLFGFAALWSYLRHRRTGSVGLLAASALLAGASLSVKWTGLSFLGLIIALEGLRLVRERAPASLLRLAIFVVVPVVVYVGVFAIHFALLDRSGGAFAAGFFDRLLALNQRMFETSRGMVVQHPYASHWFDWPFMMRTLDFWAEYHDPLLSRIYLLGNPVVWWASAYCMLYLLVNFVPKLPALMARSVPVPATAAELLIVAAYLANMLPFTQIKRVMFIYHYLPALGFALLAVGLLLDRSGRYARWLGCTLLALAAAAFIYFAPLSYGLELTRPQFDARFWVNSWK